MAHIAPAGFEPTRLSTTVSPEKFAVSILLIRFIDWAGIEPAFLPCNGMNLVAEYKLVSLRLSVLPLDDQSFGEGSRI